MAVTAPLLLGCQGWSHAGWEGTFYPSGMPPEERLGFYASRFPTVEVSDTFSGIPPEPLISGWRDGTPAEFVFALTVPQQVTHERAFADSQELLGRFLDRASGLGDKLGPLLLRMGMGFRCRDEARNGLARFLASLPNGFKWALELRRPEWVRPEVVELVASHNVSITLVESRCLRRSAVLELARQPTADFAVVRWSEPWGRRRTLGPEEVREAFSAWSGVLADMAGRVERIFGFVGDRFAGHAPAGARELRRVLGRQPADSEEPAPQLEFGSQWLVTEEGSGGPLHDPLHRR